MILAEHVSDPNDHVYVFFPDTEKAEKIGADKVRECVKKMEESNVKRCIIVTPKGMTHYAKQLIQETSRSNTMEQFLESELLVNITKHELVPEHRVMSKEEKETLLERYKLKETQLPRILVDDPVARFLGLQRGQVVKIIRPSETTGRYVTYRLGT